MDELIEVLQQGAVLRVRNLKHHHLESTIALALNIEIFLVCLEIGQSSTPRFTTICQVELYKRCAHMHVLPHLANSFS